MEYVITANSERLEGMMSFPARNRSYLSDILT